MVQSCEMFSENEKRPYPTLEGERVAARRMAVAVALPALAAEQHVPDPTGENLHHKKSLIISHDFTVF